VGCCGPHRLATGDTLGDGGVARLDGSRKGQVRQGVFVGAIHLGVTRQGCQLLQGVEHLRRRAFEEPAAARRKRVSPQNSAGAA
jgi:hypothetical protein